MGSVINEKEVIGYAHNGEEIFGLINDNKVLFELSSGNGLKEGCSACWEAMAGDLIDLTGNGNTAILHGQEIYDEQSDVIDFRSNAVYYEVPYSEELTFNNADDTAISFTIHTHFSIQAFNWSYLFAKRKTYSDHEYGFFFWNSSSGIWTKVENKSNRSRSVVNAEIPLQELITLTVTYSIADGAKLYINGSLISGGTNSMNGLEQLQNSGSEIYIGCAQPNTNVFDGQLKQLAIWKNRALTTEEVAILYNGGNALKYEDF